MATIPVKWTLEYVTRGTDNAAPVLPKKTGTNGNYSETHYELPQGEWEAKPIAPSRGLAQFEARQPDAKEIVGRSDNSQSASRALLVAPHVETSSQQLDPSEISFTHDDFPAVRPFDVPFNYEPVNGTITIPATGGAVVYAANAGNDGGFFSRQGRITDALWMASVSPLRAGLAFERIGNRYDFKANSSFATSSGLGNETPPGYGATLIFEQGGQTEEIQGADISTHGGTAKYAWSRTFTGSGGPIYFQVRDSTGRETPRTRVYLKEIPRVTWTQDEDDEATILADASASFAPASIIQTYNWFGPVDAALDERGQVIPNGVTPLASGGGFTTRVPRVRFRFYDVGHDHLNGPGIDGYVYGYLGLSLTGSDAPPAPFLYGENEVYRASRSLAIPVDPETIDVVTMPDGARITARDEAGGQIVVVRRIEQGQDEGNTIYSFWEHSRPRLALHRDGRVALLARNNKTQNFVRFEAAELSRKWGAPLVIWNNKPRYADILTLHGAIGEHEVEVSVAAVRRKDDTQILFKESKDGGATWPADADAVKVGTVPRAIPIAIREARTGGLEITDGAKVLFRSLKGGAADSWVAI
ncbi:MAG: hypothetical protein KY445_04745 [Armatimonadetes bacterium]|nr:hypothetical protein [Armatimonadota bacterium]